MAYQPQSSGPFLKGLIASNQPLAQPKGSFPRGSNLVMMERGALTPCDGSGIINALGGVVLGNQGRFLSTFLYEPIGVTPYYLALQVGAFPLGAPLLKTATAVAGGSLTNGTKYYYVITAIDGVGGETVASNELSETAAGANLSIQLVWNVVPGALGYNIYRSTSAGTEVKLVDSTLPVLQPPPPITSTVTFTDTGISSFTTLTFNNVTATGYTNGGQAYIQFNLSASDTLPAGSIIGLPLTSSAFDPTTFNGSWTVFSVPSSKSVIVKGGPGSGSAGSAAVSVGPLTAGTGANMTGPGTNAWSNTSGVTGVGTPANVALPNANPNSKYLAFTNFGFAGIPGGATILGIQVEITKSISSTFADEVFDLGVFLLKNGVIVGTDHSSPDGWVPSGVSVYGGPTDLWGTTWADTDFNGVVNFGGVIAVTGEDDTVSTLFPNVSLVRITVYYTTGTGGTLVLSNTSSTSNPPTMDTTEQTVLYKMPNTGALPIPYSAANIVAYYPAAESQLGVPPSGGSGGGGTTGPGTLSNSTSSTPSGGIVGLVGPLPQFKQFTNRVVIALGNGFSMQLYWDSSGSAVNPAPTGSITGVAVVGDQVTFTVAGTITLSTTDPTANGFMPVGTNVIISNASDATYNGTFVVIAVTPGAGGTFTVRNTTASGGATTATFTDSTTPIISNFIPAYPVWTANTAYAVGDIIVPATQPATSIYLINVQQGVSGAAEPTPWSSTIGDQKADGSAIWKTAALLNSAAPPPLGAGHIEIYAGSLWAFNTYPTDEAKGLDGPTSIRMSNVNNPFGWNPVNQAFLDKDDGAEGMGMGKFTITAQGIPPEGSLIAFKYRVPYQILGVFGANNFAIQPVSSDMGCLAPRTIIFVPGFGLARYCHLGFAVFDGWKDTVISEQIRPYLFPINDFDAQDITVADANYLPLSWAAQTANPPMYAIAMPIGNSGGKLTRMFLYDLILKAWAGNTDLPFPISCMAQVQPVTSNPLTIIGGFNDGCIQRWQAGDLQWYTNGGASAVNVQWSLRTITIASQSSSQRLWARKLIVRGTNAGASGRITVQPRVSAVAQAAVPYTIPGNGDFDLFADIGLTGLRFDADISGNLHVEIDGIDYAVEPRPFGVPVQAI